MLPFSYLLYLVYPHPVIWTKFLLGASTSRLPDTCDFCQICKNMVASWNIGLFL